MPDAHDTETLAEVLTDAERATLHTAVILDAIGLDHERVYATVERIIAARIVQARAGEGALREAADEWPEDMTRGESQRWLGDRADRLATDTAAPEGLWPDGTGRTYDEWKAATPVAIEGVEALIPERVAVAALVATGRCTVQGAQESLRHWLASLPPVEPETSEPEGGDEDG